jgi:NTE family protein
MRSITLLIIFNIILSVSVMGQKVGLVLSGGGADALAHIGVIKALEEENIPIDFITGTSMGAMIGALYASGVPIEDIEAYFTSPNFIEVSSGNILEEFHYYYPHPTPNPDIISLKFKKKENGYSLLVPTKVISSESFDFDAVKLLAHAEKLANYDFDSLLIPFRCVAADIVSKELIVFKSGSLTEALRASMSYPFFIRPIKINDHLMYDGGIYNNFPVDVMCSDFDVEYIIGSNVSRNIPEPTEDDLLGQLQNILIQPTDFSIYCKEGELIEPKTNFGTFSFENAQEAIDSGYVEAKRHIQHINYHMPARTNKTEVKLDTSSFQTINDSINIGEIVFRGINSKQGVYAGSVLKQKRKKEQHLTLETFERNYFRLFQETYIESIRTKLHFNRTTKLYDAIIDVLPIKSYSLQIGGNIATRPISVGYASFTYSNLSTYGMKVGVSTHYGKMYQAINVFVQFDFPFKVPVFIKPKFVIQNWNWFESRQANLFVSEKPNYIIEGELYSGIEIGTALGNKHKLTLESTYLQMQSNYYQTKSFTPSDTTDNTRFNGLNTKGEISKNSLNLKQYAYAGERLEIKATYTFGNEFYQPGSTSNIIETSKVSHSFIQLKLDYQKYFRADKKLRLGLAVTGAFSNMPFFENYTSTVIQAPAYKPTPDSRTLFLESFHASKYAAVGGQIIWIPIRNLQFRAEGYVFQPYQSYIKTPEGKASYGAEFADRFAIISGTVAYETPFGPLSFSTNYYYNNPDISPEDEAPMTVLLNFGYIIFNNSAYH